eukprot:9478524-Pyramimonas_sp.AAC.1
MRTWLENLRSSSRVVGTRMEKPTWSLGLVGAQALRSSTKCTRNGLQELGKKYWVLANVMESRGLL